MIIQAIITAIIVSIDGFFCGFAVGIKKTKINIKNLLIISIIPIIMAMPVMIIGNYISNIISSNIANYIGFILFIFLAITSLSQIKNKEDKNDNTITLINSIIIGFTIGIDSSISAFTLALNHHNPFITPFYFGLSHGILIYLGNKISLKKTITNINLIEYLSPILFIIIAITKII